MISTLWSLLTHHWAILAGGGALIGVAIALVTALGPAAVLGMLKVVPRWCWEVLIVLALLLAYGLHERSVGERLVQADWDAAKREQAAFIAQVGQKQDQVLRQTVTQYVDRVKVVHDQGATQIKQVPIYVTAQNDAQCTINGGFVRLWNAANTGVQLPNVPIGADGQASGVVLSDVEKQHIAESTYTRSIEAQLSKLQDAIDGVTTAGRTSQDSIK